MIQCKICDKKLKSYKSLGLHITRGHKLSVVNYYNQYVDAIKHCKLCSNKAIFYGINKGYGTYCSIKCASSDLGRLYGGKYEVERLNGFKAWNQSLTKEERNIRNKYMSDFWKNNPIKKENMIEKYKLWYSQLSDEQIQDMKKRADNTVIRMLENDPHYYDVKPLTDEEIEFINKSLSKIFNLYE